MFVRKAQNDFLIIEKPIKINRKKSPKTIYTFDFHYTLFSHTTWASNKG